MTQNTARVKPLSAVLSRAAAPRRPKRRKSTLGTIYGASLVIFYTVLFLVPFGVALWLAFQNWDFLTRPRYVGIRNFVKASRDPYFWQALRVTLNYSVVGIFVGVVVAMLLALMLHQLHGKWQNVFLSLYYLPVVTPGVVTIFLWRWLLTPTGGAFNTVLDGLGLPQQQFLNSTTQALYCIILMGTWAGVGGTAVVFLAGMNDVPESLYEAAKLDGAGFWQSFFKITLPLIRPVLAYVVVVSVIGTVQSFDTFFLMSGPGFSTRTLALYTYQLGFQSLNMGYGAAVSLIIFAMLLAATVFQLQRWQVSWEY